MGKLDLIKEKCNGENFDKLSKLDNDKLFEFISKYVQLCDPESIFVRTDKKEDKEYIRNKALSNKEEMALKTQGHSIHFDGYNDQGRDKKNTKYIVSEDVELSSHVNRIDKTEGLEEIHNYLKGSMGGREMIIGFFCLGPINSEFSIPCVQITDSFYVAHSEGILYRSGYEYFKTEGNKTDFFKFVHSAGVLENNTSKNIDKRRVFINLEDNQVLSVNTQYAGNTVGLKKLAMRLAIRKSSRENWLTEHMFVMNVAGPGGRDTYFTGAFPSACGKTSTAMLEGETIVGDDIAYLRRRNDKIYAVNVEAGIFGIIQDINTKGDPSIYEALTTSGEVIFSNVLKTEEGIPYWTGNGTPVPEKGVNFSGNWTCNKKDSNGNNIPASHKNARYTVSLSKLKNRDKNADNPAGVPISGIIYGGRDSDTSVPVEESFGWQHGIITKGASLESETTAATLGKEGVRVFNPMSNIDFLSITIGQYIKNNLNIVSGLDNPPKIFSVNYFLKGDDGKYLNEVKDKHVWVKWMERRVNGELSALKTPTGYIPKYEDLKDIFRLLSGKEYTKKDYEEQFTIRIPENIAKIDRILSVYKKEGADIPAILFEILDKQRQQLLDAKVAYDTDYISPFDLK